MHEVMCPRCGGLTMCKFVFRLGVQMRHKYKCTQCHKRVPIYRHNIRGFSHE